MHKAMLLSASLFAFPVGAYAAEAGAMEDDQAILVIGEQEGYVAENSITATKTDTPLIDVPQTINVVTREQIEDQAHRSMADVLRYVPGTTVGQGEGNRDQITLRGQNTTADFFLDGVRDDVQYYRNLYNIERVEVLKGPYALIFGRGGGGGIINRVQKAPSADSLFASAAGSANTFGAWEVSGDVNLPVAEGAAIRLNGFYENLDNNRDAFEGERYAFNPHLAVTVSENWRAGISYEYVHDDRVTDRGVPSQNGAPLEGYRDTFFGVPGVNRTGLDAHIVKARLDGDLADNLTWSTTVLYGDYDKYYTNVYANGPVSDTGTVALAAYADPTKRENFLAQSNLVWDFTVGAVTNKVLLGVEYGTQDSRNQRQNVALSSTSVDLANIVYPTVTFGGLSRDTKSNVDFVSVYAQDQIGIGQHFDLVVGIRYDRFEIEGTDFMATPDRPFARTDSKVSPRFGLIFKPQENISLYGSYSRSFLPRSGDQFITLNTAQEDLAPEKFTNWEVGGKWNIKPHLAATIALFQLDRTNATTRDPDNIGQETVVGKTRTRGVELALTGKVTKDWQISGGYTYQNAKVAGTGGATLVRLPQVPRHQFALWNRYDVNGSVGIGLGVIRQSSQLAAIRTSTTSLPTRLPGFTRVDAALFLKASEKVELQLNIENLLDKEYFADAHNNNNITPGAPINARLSARIAF